MSGKKTTVLCVTTGEVFNSMKEAAAEHGIKDNLISNCCRGVQQTAGGLEWSYVGHAPTLRRPTNSETALCWKCHLADHWVDEPTPCPWARDGKPVEGWTAVPGTVRGSHKKLEAFKVIQCPLFKPNERRRKRDKGTAKSIQEHQAGAGSPLPSDRRAGGHGLRTKIAQA